MQIASRETPLHHTQALFQLFIFPPSWPLISKDIEGTWIPHDPLSPQSPVLRKDATDTSHPCSVTELSPHCRHLVSQNWVFFLKKKKLLNFPCIIQLETRFSPPIPSPKTARGEIESWKRLPYRGVLGLGSGHCLPGLFRLLPARRALTYLCPLPTTVSC